MDASLAQGDGRSWRHF